MSDNNKVEQAIQKPSRIKAVTNTVAWNLFLIFMGGLLFSIGVKCIAIHHGFISGGLFGTGMLIYYFSNIGSSSLWYFLLNIPMVWLGWKYLSRRFVWYTLFGFVCTSILSELINYDLGIQDPLLAAIATGIFCGAGSGLIIRSRGSDGGVTIVSIILHQYYNIRMGQSTFAYNFILFVLGGLTVMNLDRVMYSIIIVFLTSYIMDYFAALFNQRKMALIISEKYEEIAAGIFARLHRGATFLHGTGSYSKQDRTILLTVVHNYQIKALEEVVFSHDDKAFVIIENTFNVLGTGFSSRTRY
ncbi:MAG: YitT family protein [Deltaproteobacteria bacterium]|jgi:uncharacterized membrane-anchored protein YitT (DUF2179 family)|nr:YitT family protein [Deltaproteobacteria bacterium]